MSDDDLERQAIADHAYDVLVGNVPNLTGITPTQRKILSRLHKGKLDAKFLTAMREEHSQFDRVTLPRMVLRRLIVWQPADPLHGKAERLLITPVGTATLARHEQLQREAFALRGRRHR